MRLLCVGALLFAVGLFGCSGEPSRLGVEGTVKIDGVPAPMTVIRFFPTNPDADPRSANTAKSDEKGIWSLKQDGKNAGLPVGDYKVTFSQTTVRGKPVLSGSGGKKNERLAGELENVPEIYRNPATTTITAHVSNSSTTFDFDIKRK